jgi:uncharacterized protein (TIGR03790 family)
MRRFLAAAVLVPFLAVAALAGGGPAETVLLVNSASADSKKVADYYAKKRCIPRAQVCEVKCTTELTTSIDDFVKDVVDPLRSFLRERGLEDRCRFVVMTQGMPIVAKTPGGDVSTAAALSVLDTSICGRPQTYSDIARRAIVNPYKDGAAPTGRILDGGRFLLVTALLSSTADEAIALVDRSVASDGTAPPGARFVFQDASGNANVRNDKYDAARADLESAGFATEHDAAGADKVKGRENVMGYMSGGCYSALTVDGVNSNKYAPGAICDMLQSFGAVPANFNPDPKSGKSQFPVTHMVRAGITGVHGAVSEPFSFAFPDVKLFATYVEGYTLAEAFHQRLPIVYWMNLTLGDPLCAPYAKRPTPKFVAKGAWEGIVKADVSAPRATRVDVYLDGRAVASTPSAEGEVSIDTASFANGPHELLVEATGAGPTEPRGWTTSIVTTHNATAPTSKVDGRVRCEKLLVDPPAPARAGESGIVRLMAVGADGKPVEGWKGRVELRTSSPPVRWAVVDAESPAVEISITFTKAMDYDLRATAVDDGREATTKFTVRAADFDHATTPASNYPLGQAADLVVVLEDKFGNRLKDWAGSVAVEVPEDPSAEIPAPVAMTASSGGACRIRGLLLTHAGPTKLVFKSADGATLSQAGEGVTVGPAPVRPWLFAGPASAKELFAADPCAAATGEGSVAAKMLLRRRAGGDQVQFSPVNAKRDEAAVLVTWVESLGATKARLLAAAPGHLRVFVDGKETFDGVSKATDGKGKREPVAELQFAEGTHRLVVVVEAKGATTASFEIDDGAGKFPSTLRIRARAHETPKTFVVSGRVLDKKGGGVAGATITVKGADGRDRIATSAADGTWWVEGLSAGEISVKAAAGARAFADADRKATFVDENLVDVDFRETDETPKPPTTK